MAISSLHIKNFKSIKDSGNINLKPINVLIGANGAGKSNFIGFFKFLHKLYHQELQHYVSKNGRANNFLHFGVKVSDKMYAQIINEPENELLEFTLETDMSDNFIFIKEVGEDITSGKYHFVRVEDGNGDFESKLKNTFNAAHFQLDIMSYNIYHFNDTSFSAKVFKTIHKKTKNSSLKIRKDYIKIK